MDDLTKLLHELYHAGLYTRRGRGGHLKIYDQDGRRVVTASSSPSSRFAVANIRADLKRAGINLGAR